MRILLGSPTAFGELADPVTLKNRSTWFLRCGMNTDEWSRKLEEMPLIDLPPAGPGPLRRTMRYPANGPTRSDQRISRVPGAAHPRSGVGRLLNANLLL